MRVGTGAADIGRASPLIRNIRRGTLSLSPLSFFFFFFLFFPYPAEVLYYTSAISVPYVRGAITRDFSGLVAR